MLDEITEEFRTLWEKGELTQSADVIELYEQITRRRGFERVLMGIDLGLQLRYNPVKVNSVVLKGGHIIPNNLEYTYCFV